MVIFAIIILWITWNYDAIKASHALPLKTYTSKADNARCLKCHAGGRYEMPDPEDSTRKISGFMQAGNIIDTLRYYHSTHWDFKCTDCHSDEYNVQPHNPELKSLPMSTCLDCHGGDENYAKYHFEDIDTAFMAGDHYKAIGMDFNCWSCHDAHYDMQFVRDSTADIRRIVEYDNNMCLKCHDKSGTDTTTKISGKAIPDMTVAHLWLPESSRHLTSVRCIDCHAKVDDQLLVSHQIVNKADAVRNCEACHTENSLLLKTLYKNRPVSGKRKSGFLKNITRDSKIEKVLKKNPELNIILLSATALLLIGVLFVVFRWLIPFSENSGRKK